MIEITLLLLSAVLLRDEFLIRKLRDEVRNLNAHIDFQGEVIVELQAEVDEYEEGSDIEIDIALDDDDEDES